MFHLNGRYYLGVIIKLLVKYQYKISMCVDKVSKYKVHNFKVLMTKFKP